MTDDYLAFVAATRQSLKAWMLPDLVVELAAREELAYEAAEAILTTIRPRYRRGVIEHNIARLQEEKIVPKVVVPVKEEILRAAERRKAAGGSEDIAQFLAELIDLGFEHRLQQLYRQFESGEISLGYFAERAGPGRARSLCCPGTAWTPHREHRCSATSSRQSG